MQTTQKSKLSKKVRENQRIGEICHRLDEEYPDVHCALHHKNPYELLVATILSAQCTDVRVNTVTPALFERYPSPKELAEAEVGELQNLIHSTGFFRNKAKNLIGAANEIMFSFKGKVPESMEELLTLPGVARKTANVVLGTAFDIADGVVVDTHVKRLSNRLGLTHHQDPNKIEKDLMCKISKKRWIYFSHQLIHHGRGICKARSPKCGECTLTNLCPYAHEVHN
ncbi:MAG: endonuclease III [Acidobacteriota bacterium]|jgi:endonuclease-3|nr:endonuclease III [Acidobacteriota bacterium]